ncbi:hypothetical protein JCM10212_003792 [Sporobolomyces blumeae]
MFSPSIPTAFAADGRSVTFRADHDGAPSVDVSPSNSTAPLLPVNDSLNLLSALQRVVDQIQGHCLRLSNALDGAAQAACELQIAREPLVREVRRYLFEVELFVTTPDATASTASMADDEDVNGDVATAEEVNGDHLGGEGL